ncbi:MAG: thiamine pyrophosphate-dependent enzyme [Candidatus Ranarchaeia archaeon]
MVNLSDLKTPVKNTWCPGCGNFGIYSAVTRAITKLGFEREEYVIVSGIGCHGKIMNYINVNAVHGIHGRVLPFATGLALANPNLKVIGHAGDADCYDEGWEHFTHALRRNIDMTLIVHDNKVLGLTTGQTTSTSELGFKSKSTPYGATLPPLNPIAQAIISDGTFIARGFSGDMAHLQGLVIQAIRHKGLGFIDVLQPCATFNYINTFQWYRQRVYRLEDTDHDFTSKDEALKRSYEWGDKIPIGVFYKKERPTYRDAYTKLSGVSLHELALENIDLKPLYKKLS